MTEQARTLTLDGETYEVAKFSQQVQQAVDVYNAINADLTKNQLEVIKCQAALQNLGAQIAAAVKKELEPAAEAPAEAAATEAAAG